MPITSFARAGQATRLFVPSFRVAARMRVLDLDLSLTVDALLMASWMISTGSSKPKDISIMSTFHILTA